MFKTIFLKTIYEKRWGLLAWSLAMVVFTLMVVALFPTFQESLGTSLQDVPESLKPFLGDASDYQRLNGFIDLQVFAQMIWLTVIYGLILCTGLIAGEESDGTLQSLLAQPVSRSRVYFDKLAASMTILAVVSLSMTVTIVLGVAMISDSINIGRLMEATLAFWLVTLFLSLLAYAVSAATGRRGLTGALIGIYGFAGFMITSLSETVKGLRYVNYLSPFKYFNTPSVLDNGLSARNVTVLVVSCLIFVVSGWLVFRKRDIFAR